MKELLRSSGHWQLGLAVVALAACAHEETVAQDAWKDDARASPYADGAVDDAVKPQPVAATPGTRCPVAERVGLVVIAGYDYAPDDLQVWGRLLDRPHPLYGEPTLEDESCAFYACRATAPCDPPCEGGSLCSLDGECTPAPVPAFDAELVLRADGHEQRFTPDNSGSINGLLELAGDRFAVELRGNGVVVTLVETTVPSFLESVTGTLSGTCGRPTGFDIEWPAPPELDSHVYTHIPINHHAQGLSFTECTVPAAAGSVHIDEPMLTPLAVITGLEFQGAEHLRFAAAETALGCVELRFQRYTDPSFL